MTDVDHERWSEDLAAYLLGALEPERAEAIARHADGCERCRAELRWLTPAAQALPEGVRRMEPPPELRARLMAEVEADAARSASQAEPPRASELDRRRPSWLARLGAGPMGLRPVAGVAAAILVVAAIAGFALGGGLGSGADGGGESTIAAGRAPGVTATMVNEGDSGTLRLANVHQLPDGKVLEAWVQRDGEVEPVRALFVPDRDGRASTRLPGMDGVEAVMVTAEPKGGSEQPTGEPLITISL